MSRFENLVQEIPGEIRTPYINGITTDSNVNLNDILHRISQDLQLPESMFNKAKEAYQTVGNWLAQKDSLLASWKPEIYPQGSLRLGTTNKPFKSDEYDLDIMCEMTDLNSNQINSQMLHNYLAIRLNENKMYQGNIEIKKRCVRINYKENFHLDVVPGVQNIVSNNNDLCIPDREKKNWTFTNPKGYADWFKSRCKFIIVKEAHQLDGKISPFVQYENDKEPLKRAVQIIKRWRDGFYQDYPEPPRSIVLTTLAGKGYKNGNSIVDAISEIIEYIMLTIEKSNNKPFKVLNPVDEKENFADRWEQNPKEYTEFCKGIFELNKLWEKIKSHNNNQTKQQFLNTMLGEGMVKKASAQQYKLIEHLRQQGYLGVSASGMLITNVLDIPSVPIKRNTFYGE